MWEPVLTGLSGGAVVAFFAWLLRESIKASIQRDVTAHAEHLKHDLQREMLKAQLTTTQVHAVYPLLLMKLRKAQGAVEGPLGFQFKPSYKDFGLEDFKIAIDGMNLTILHKQHLLSLAQTDRSSLIDALHKVDREADLRKARAATIRAKNYTILKSLFISEQSRALALEACSHLFKALIEDEAQLRPMASHSHLEQAQNALDALECRMREELGPAAKRNSASAPLASSATATATASSDEAA